MALCYIGSVADVGIFFSLLGKCLYTEIWLWFSYSPLECPSCDFVFLRFARIMGYGHWSVKITKWFIWILLGYYHSKWIPIGVLTDCYRSILCNLFLFDFNSMSVSNMDENEMIQIECGIFFIFSIFLYIGPLDRKIITCILIFKCYLFVIPSNPLHSKVSNMVFSPSHMYCCCQNNFWLQRAPPSYSKLQKFEHDNSDIIPTLWT